MNHSQNNQRGRNLILISNPSDRFPESELPIFNQRLSSIGSELGGFFNNASVRQSSNTNNIFQTFKKDQKIKQQPKKQQQPLTQSQKYAQQCLQYQKYHYDDKIKLIIHRMSIKAYQTFKDKNDHNFLSLSIQKLFSIIAKKLLLNRFELLFLLYVIEETKWKYDNECISRHSNEFQSYSQLCDGEGENVTMKRLEIYLLFCSFYSKKSLNQFPNQNIYNGYLKSLCPKFKQNFNEWTQSSNVMNIKINPKVLNSIFKRLMFYSGRDIEQIQNYCILVEQIIEISPAYNAEKGQTKKKNQKKIKKQQQQQFMMMQQQKSQSQSYRHNRFNQQLRVEEYQSDVREELPNLRNKKQTSYVSNVDGLDPEIYLKQHQRMI